MSFFTAYFILNDININFSILIIWIREKGSLFLLHVPISRSYVVSVRRSFFFLLLLGQAVLFYFGPP